MGMTIDKRIAQLVRVKHYASPRHYETLDVAIDTMKKYQKIGQIVSDDYYLSDYNKIKDIKGVIDGKID